MDLVLERWKRYVVVNPSPFGGEKEEEYTYYDNGNVEKYRITGIDIMEDKSSKEYYENGKLKNEVIYRNGRYVETKNYN